MTMYDKQLTFATAASVAMTAGSTALVLTDTIPLVDLTLTIGQPMYFVCVVTTAIVAAGAGTLRVELVSDTSSVSTGTAANSVTYHIKGPEITTANNSTSNPAGKVLIAQALPHTVASADVIGNPEAILGARIVATTQNLSSGNVTCFLTQDPGKYKAYANAI